MFNFIAYRYQIIEINRSRMLRIRDTFKVSAINRRRNGRIMNLISHYTLANAMDFSEALATSSEFVELLMFLILIFFSEFLLFNIDYYMIRYYLGNLHYYRLCKYYVIL